MIPPLPADPRLPALEAVFDGPRVAALLARHLAAWAEGAGDPGGFRAAYVRYKPGTRCLVRFEGPPAGSHDFFVVVYSAGMAERVAARPSLARLAARAARHHPAGPAARTAWLPELGAVAQVFPVDRHLPGLVRATAPRPMRRVLGAHVRAVDVLRHKPARKALVRYALDGDAPAGEVYGKLYAAGSGAHAVAAARHLSARGVPTPAPLETAGAGTAPGLVLHPAAPGDPLRQIGRGTPAYLRRLPAAADALARLHRAGGDAARGRDPALAALGLPRLDPLRAAVAAGGAVAAIAPDLAGRVAALTARLARGWDDAAPGAVGLVHGDFYDDQVLVDGAPPAEHRHGACGSATVIDLDELGWGDAAIDVASFAAHVSAWPAVDGRAAEAARAAWLDLWPVADGGAEAARLRLEAAALLGVALAPFRALWPDWPRAVERRLALAEARCGEADRAARRRFGAGAGRGAPRGPDARWVGPMPPPDLRERRPDAEAPAVDPGGAPPAFHDPALPQLAALLDGRQAPAFLGRAAAEAGLHAPVHAAAITVVRHKPGRRCVIRYDVAERDAGAAKLGAAPDGTEADAPTVWYGKTFASRRGARVLAAHRAVAEAAALGTDVRVPRPIAYLPDLDLCLLDAVPGRPVADALAAGDTALAERIADALGALHASGVALPRRHGLADELRPLAGRVEGLAATHPDLGAVARRCLAAVLRGAGAGVGGGADGGRGADAAAPDGDAGWRWRPVHRDFYHDQVLVDGAGGLAVLDFDDAALSEPAVDVANFGAHLRLLAEQRPADRAAIERCRVAFAARCTARDAGLDGARVRLLEAATCLRLAAIHAPRADGRRLAAAMLETALRRLGEAVG